MPKLAWVAVAGAFIGEHWGRWGMLGIAVLEIAGLYLTGFYEAWKADRSK